MTIGPKSKCGSTTIEFIFCAPLLVILMLVAMELNERIEQRVTSAIATGSSGWLTNSNPTPQSADLDPLGHVMKADILGTRSAGSSPIVGFQAGAVLEDSAAVMTYSDSKRQADHYSLKLRRSQNPDSSERAINRASTTIGTGTFDDVASKVNNTASRIGAGVRNISDNRYVSIFPSNDVEELSATWSTSDLGSSNRALKTIEDLAVNMDRSQASAFSFAAESKYRVLAHHSLYLRRDAQYHPDRYKENAKVAAILGLFNSEYEDFNKKCFMKLVIDAGECGSKSGFVDYIRNVRTVVTSIETIIDLVSKSPTLAAPFAQAFKMVLLGVADQLLADTQKKVADAISGKINDALQSVGSEISRATDSIKNELKNSTSGIHEKVKQAAEDALPEDPTHASTP